MTIIDLETFLKLPTNKVAELVRATGPQVCVFPLNGTRRWFMLEHGDADMQGDPAKLYVDTITKRHIEIYKRCFVHGLDTLVTPVFGGELLNRGDEYVNMAIDGMMRLTTQPDFLSFYEEYQVRLHFYGDYRKQLTGTPFASLCDSFDRITKETAKNNRYRLFYGVSANDATETTAELSIQYYQNRGHLPTRRDLIESYYGEYIEKATIFIGFEKFNVFDYPMLGWGEESLYFTVAPSLYLNDGLLRQIIYDHLYLRPVQDPDYNEMPELDFELMRTHYQNNREVAFGVGEMCGGIWYAKTQVQE